MAYASDLLLSYLCSLHSGNVSLARCKNDRKLPQQQLEMMKKKRRGEEEGIVHFHWWGVPKGLFRILMSFSSSLRPWLSTLRITKKAYHGLLLSSGSSLHWKLFSTWECPSPFKLYFWWITVWWVWCKMWGVFGLFVTFFSLAKMLGTFLNRLMVKEADSDKSHNP